jgi:glycosyltransferase involved in cell wall biosynthesis
MRILHVVTAFARGPEDVIVPWLVELIVRQRAAGHDAEVFTSAYRGGGNAEFRGIPVHRFRYAPARWEDLTHDEAAPDRMRRSLRHKLLPFSYVAGGMLAIRRLCRRRRYDVVHVHWPVPHALFGAVARAAGGARLVTHWYGVELRWVQSSLWWLRWLARWALRTSDAVVAISSYTAREIERLGAGGVPVRTIPYTTSLAPGPPPARRPSPDGAFRILFVGRLVARKGVTHLVEAVRRLPPDIPVRLEIVGEGPERPRLAAQIARDGLEERVVLRGRLPDADLRAAYQAADVLVLPSVVDARSDTEGLGVVLLEAMSYGVPVIASALGGITDIVRDGETGLLVPGADPGALAAALRRVAEDKTLAARLGAAGAHRAATVFAWPAIMAQWDECYAAVTRRRTDTATRAAPTATPPRAGGR